MIKSFHTLISICLLPVFLFGQNEIVPLWEEQIPNYRITEETETIKIDDISWIQNIQKPSLEILLPAKANASGMAMIVCPGGGYQGLAYDWEGTDIAKWLNSKGIAAFVLKYRLPISNSVTVNHETPLLDAQRAIKLIRHQAHKFNIESDKIGIMGFSAGGHLASTAGTHFDFQSSTNNDSIDYVSARPDFIALIYPVITMTLPYTHEGSRKALLGENAEQRLVEYYSNELQVNKDTPPTFLVHSMDDKAVPVENSLLFYQALKKFNVSAEMHLYPEGGHGYSLAIGKGHLQTWPDRLHDWLLSLKL